MKKFCFALLVGSPFWYAPRATLAAEEGTTAPALEEIVVTARKRSEDLQSVPIAVSAFTGSFIEQQFTDTVSDLSKYTPNVRLQPNQFTGGGLTAAIRGVGFSDLEKSFEPAVGVSVDGLFLANNTGATVDSFDIGSVEILRGPQGTLFGRNTIGGTINITRTRPTGDWGLKASASYESYDNRKFKLIANAPLISDVLALKVGGFAEKGNTFTRNYFTGREDSGPSKAAFTSALLFTPSSEFEALVSYDHINDKSQYPNNLNETAPGALLCNILPGGLGCIGNSFAISKANDFRYSFSSTPFSASLLSDAVSLNMTYHGSWYDVTSISGYIGQHDGLSEENSGAPDLGGIPIFPTTRVGTSDQFSEEVRMTSKLDSWFNYVAGLYYFKSRYTLNPQIATLLGTPIQDLTAAQDSKSYAAFTETYWDVAPKTRLTVGARYTHEEKEFQITSFNTFAPMPYPIVYTCPDPALAAIPALAACRDPTVAFSKVTPRVSVDYKFTPDLMLYATFSQGFRSGGWDGRATSPTSIGPYAPETVNNYEAGIRSEWFEHRLRTNFTIFDEKYKNKQEEVLSAAPDAPAGTIETETKNAAAATLEGFELEVTVVPVENVSLYASAGYLNSHYDKFVQLDPSTGVTTDVTNTHNLRYAPRWTANGGGNWKMPVPQIAGRIIASANYKWTADVFGSPIIDTTGLNRDVVPGYGVFDTSLTYEHPLANGRSLFRTSAYVNDAFHGGGRESSSLDAGVFYFANVVQARTVGIEIQFEY